MSVYAVSLSRLGGVVLSRDQSILDAIRAEAEASGDSYHFDPVDEDDDDWDEEFEGPKPVSPTAGMTWWDVKTALVHGDFRDDIPADVYVRGFEQLCSKFGTWLRDPGCMKGIWDYIERVDLALKSKGVSFALHDLLYDGPPFDVPHLLAESISVGHIPPESIATGLEQLSAIDVSDLDYEVEEVVPLIRGWYEEAALLADGCLVGFLHT
jgi:hypothetical protein